MSRKNFPESNKQYLQNNRSDVFPKGNIWSTFSVDLQSNVGVLRISPRLKAGITTADDADPGCPVAFKYYKGKIWAICGTRIFTNSGDVSDSWTEDATTGFQTDYSSDYSDLEIFNGALCSTTEDALYSTNGSSWTSRDSISPGIHVMTYFKKFDRLYYSNLGDNIESVDTIWVNATFGSDYAISLGPSAQYEISALKASSDWVWIGTINNLSEGMTGKIMQWDGISAQVSDEFELGNAQGVMAIAINPADDSPYAMDSNGILSAWNGNGFSEVGRLPFLVNQLPYNISNSDSDRFIHPNGMYFTKNGTVRCAINNRPNISAGQVIENLPSGIWEWSKENGFVHIEPFTYNPRGSTTITDFGQNRIARVGALTSMNIYKNSVTDDGTMLVGATIYTDATNTTSGIFFDNSLDTIQKKGYVVIDWFESDEIADAWDVFWMSYRRFLNSTDNITLKYRFIEEAPVEAAITWVNTTSFTVLNSAVDVSDYWTSGTGNEVEILRGTGGGLCAHITNAVNVAGTWTVTIDETATGVTTGTATARFQKWIKAFPSPSNPLASPNNWTQFAIGGDSQPRIQLKLCFTFTGDGEYYKGIITSNEDIKATK